MCPTAEGPEAAGVEYPAVVWGEMTGCDDMMTCANDKLLSCIVTVQEKT